MLGCLPPLGLAFVVVGNALVLLRVFLINLEDDLRVLVHFLVALRNDKSVLALTAQNQELNCFLLEASSLTVVRNHQCTLRQLGLRPKYVLCLFWVVEEL